MATIGWPICHAGCVLVIGSLQVAAAAGHKDTVEWLLAKGALINYCDKQHEPSSALVLAILSDAEGGRDETDLRHESIVEVLLLPSHCFTSSPSAI